MLANLRQARKAAGYRQAEVAEKLNIARTTLVAIEAGQRRLREDEARHMAALYGVTMEHIYSEEPVITETDCREATGVTVGLVDSLLTICRVLATRDLTPLEVQEALKDLGGDEDFLLVRRSAFHASRQSDFEPVEK